MNERQVLRGFLASLDVLPPLIVTFQFNPTTIDDNKTIKYGPLEKPDGTLLKYNGGGPRTIKLSFKLDGLERGTNALNPTALDNGISTELAKLRSFLYPTEDAWAILPSLGGGGKRVQEPPRCYFGFGTRLLECQVTAVDIKETQFNSLLAPVRADVTVTLNAIEQDGSILYELDKQHRNLLAALGLQNIRLF